MTQELGDKPVNVLISASVLDKLNLPAYVYTLFPQALELCRVLYPFFLGQSCRWHPCDPAENCWLEQNPVKMQGVTPCRANYQNNILVKKEKLLLIIIIIVVIIIIISP